MNGFTRTENAEYILGQWAGLKISTADAENQCRELGYEIDFRQPDQGNVIQALDTRHNAYVFLGCYSLAA